LCCLATNVFPTNQFTVVTYDNRPEFEYRIDIKPITLKSLN